MQFKEWFYLMEYGEILKEPLDKVHFEPGNYFDEKEAREECEEEKFDTSYYYRDIYDDYRDDPDFEGHDPNEWYQENPEPKFKNYSHLEDGEEEYQSALKDWNDERDDVEARFESAVERWEKKMQVLRDEAEETALNAKEAAVEKCVENKRKDHQKEEFDGYHSAFEVGGNQFGVTFERLPKTFEGKTVENIYNVIFTGPESTNTTKRGRDMHTIYKNLLLAVRKLIETNNVEGLIFTPAEPAMGLVYHKFYKQFLIKQFLMVGNSIYLRKDVIRDLMSGVSDDKKRRSYGNALQSYRNYLAQGRQVKAQKDADRLWKSITAPGKPVVFSKFGNSRTGIINQSYSDTATVLYIDHGYGKVAETLISKKDLVTDEQPDQYELGLLGKALQNTSYVRQNPKLIPVDNPLLNAI